MFDPITLGLLGAAVGGLTSKKPLKGAMLGGALGAGGGLLSGGGGLLGNPMAAASYGTGLGSQQTAMLAAQEAGMGSGLFGGLESAATQAKPFMQAAQTGMQVAGALTPPETPGAPPPQLPQQNGAQTLQGLVQQSPQMNIEQEAEMRKKRRMGLLGAT